MNSPENILPPSRNAEIISSPDRLERLMPNIGHRIDQVRRAVSKGHPSIAVTIFYLQKVIGMRAGPNDPLLSVFLPDDSDIETENDAGHLTSNDSLKFTDSPHVAQKYEGNAILIVTSRCHQKCTHCFRKNVMDAPTLRRGSNSVGRPRLGTASGLSLTSPRLGLNDTLGIITKEEIEKIIEDLDSPAGDKIFELILSGGEPFTLYTSKFRRLAECKDRLNLKRKLRGVPPLNISINTREPVVMPHTILDNEKLREAIEELKPLVIAIQILHPREITEDFGKVVGFFKSLGSDVRTNHPILQGINDDPDTLIKLYTRLAAMGVTPKDLIHPIKSGIPKEKCVPLERSMEIVRELIRRLPGILVPKLQCCTPNLGKSTIDPFHLKRDGGYGYDVENGEISGLRTKDGMRNQPENVM